MHKAEKKESKGKLVLERMKRGSGVRVSGLGKVRSEISKVVEGD